MSLNFSKDKICVVIGASHAGVNFAFSLRKEGWEGRIILFDKDPVLPYHRPPLSKAYLTSADAIDKNLLKSAEAYDKSGIELSLGVTINTIDRVAKHVVLSDGRLQTYDTLVLATGARPIIPPIKGLREASNVFTLRTANDVERIRKAMSTSVHKKVVIIGGGYIGLETAASLKKLGASVTVLEREERILARVTAPEMSDFFEKLHASNGVEVLTNKNVVSIAKQANFNQVMCADTTSYEADIIIVGVGVHVNVALAEQVGLDIANGIKVNEAAKAATDIYAIGDCTSHYNPHYDRFIRLESVQNAVDQAKIAAAAICDKKPVYNSIPWFWSDQYDIKLQMVGLSTGYTKALLRKEEGTQIKFSIWYFKNDELLAVDAVNNAKAYVLGTKFIKNKTKIDQLKLVDPFSEFKPAALMIK
ncbi:NAD(P)/FAD-dependent oxidoreductase [Aquimarina agarilytica]|uniref:NAD(P)/FAD-dependent oxidoreductase n=1 Tax=Aquimarina agarilytica TaxID=1087449 RepID=UPI0002890839|nr:FAD/NAD(P)-binding oxidoreductase [Aquimarina agarilytica]